MLVELHGSHTSYFWVSPISPFVSLDPHLEKKAGKTGDSDEKKADFEKKPGKTGDSDEKKADVEKKAGKTGGSDRKKADF